LLGLYITENIKSTVQVILAWVIYTIMCCTFLNVFLLGFFWSVIYGKKGPTGLRGPSGETGIVGVKGTCGIDSTEVFLIKALTDYVDGLYYSKTNTHIVDDNYNFTNNFLSNKIKETAGSRQYRVLIANLSKDNKPIIDLINYLKDIWRQWFDLIYKATPVEGSWFTDEFGDDIDNYGWVGANPFIEIRKYDVYYWGITRNFRPLKAEICRSNANHNDEKFPKPNILRTKDTYAEPRLKVIQTNDYYEIGKVSDSDYNIGGSWWSPKVQTIENERYHPVGDIMTIGHMLDKTPKTGKTTVGKSTYNGGSQNGPEMKTILVSGDIVDPINYLPVLGDFSDYWTTIYEVECPDGYTALGDVAVSGRGFITNKFNQHKCVPKECVTEIGYSTTRWETQQGGNDDYIKGSTTWNRYDRYYNAKRAKQDYTWYNSINALNNWDTGVTEANTTNGYNVMRLGERGKPFYKLNKKCLERTPNAKFPSESTLTTPLPETKEVETEFADLGIGWYGHPYKLDPKYSIFTYINLVPEGMIVNRGTGQRFYIVHVEGNDINLFNILTYNYKTTHYDGSLQAMDYDPNGTGFTLKTQSINLDYVDPNLINQAESTESEVLNFGPKIRRIVITNKDSSNTSQQWTIFFTDDKKIFKLKNIYKNNTYLYLSQHPREGNIEFTTIDVDNYKNDPAFGDITREELDNRTNFSFIPSFGTHLNIIDDDNE
jgi:hypothetical protein